VKVKAKRVVGGFLIFMFLCGLGQFFVPATEGQQASLVVDRSYWLGLASNAWNYFQPGVGVDSTTGLHSAGLGYPYFTDWDLGVYIQAIIDANQLGILSNSGTWGADSRLTKIMSFLQTRQLNQNGLPYVWYQSANGYSYGTDQQNAADAGELLVALNNLRVFRPDLAGAINNIVFTRTNYALLEQNVDSLTNSKNLYDYYVACGFAGFWPSRFSSLAGSILDNIVSAPTVSTYGVLLPVSKLMCEPMLLSVFNLAPNAKLNGLADLVYLAHEARYTATGKFAAFSEGNSGLDNPSYVYEWVVKQDGSTWVIDDGVVNVGVVPIVYFKAAVGLLAIHNSAFTEGMVSYVESKLAYPSSGYSDGVDENGRVDWSIIDKTNGMIIEAALYATTSHPIPTPIPAPTSTPKPTATPKPTPTAAPTPSVVPSSTPTPKPSLTPLSPTPSSAPSASPTQSTTPSANPTPTPTISPQPTQNAAAIASPSSSSVPPSSTPSTSQPSTSSGPHQGTQEAAYPLYYVMVVFVVIALASGVIFIFRKR
jgi:hypothetical protein